MSEAHRSTKVLSIRVPNERYERLDFIAEEELGVERPEMLAEVLELICEAFPAPDPQKLEEFRRRKSSGASRRSVLRDRLHAIVAQSVEQRFRKPLSLRLLTRHPGSRRLLAANE